MNIYQLDGTCSMGELCSVNTSKSLTKKQVSDVLDDHDSLKILIYNTTSTSVSFHKSLEKVGFKKVFEYSGNETDGSDNSKTVTSYILDLVENEYI